MDRTELIATVAKDLFVAVFSKTSGAEVSKLEDFDKVVKVVSKSVTTLDTDVTAKQ